MRQNDPSLTQAFSAAADDFRTQDGTTLGSRKISPFDEHGQFRNALAPEAGLACDGTAQANRLVAPLSAACALGTDPRGFFAKFRLPASAPAATTLLWYWGGASTGVGANSFAMLMDSTGALLFRLYGSNPTDYRQTSAAAVLGSYGPLREICLQFGADSTGRDCRINGLDVTLAADTTVNTNSTAPIDWQQSIASSYFVWEGSLAVVLKSFWPAIFRPSLTDAQDSFLLGGGVPTRFQWSFDMLPKNVLLFSNSYRITISTTLVADPDGGTSAYQFTATFGGYIGNNALPPGRFLPAGSTVRWSVWLRSQAGTQVGTVYPTWSTPNTGYNVSVTTAWTKFSGTAVCGAGVYNQYIEYLGSSAGAEIYKPSFQILGALFFLSPQAAGDGAGYQLHDISYGEIDLIVPVGGWTWSHPTRRGWVRTPNGGLSWSGTHEAKSWLGQRALPDGAVVTLLSTLSTAAATGQVTGTTNAPARWSAAAASTANAKRIAALANQLPAGTADSDRDLTTTPDGVNFTGTITAEVHYEITEGTP